MAFADSVAASLVDVVVLAGGASLDLMPLTASESKSMLCICNRPLIWYCLQPWVSAGFRSFFLCVNEDHVALRTYLLREFTGVDFYFVLVPLNTNDHPSTTCDAVKAFLSYKDDLRTGAADRDLDTIRAVTMTDSDTEEEDEEATQRGATPERRASAARRLSSARHSGRDALREERAALVGLPRDAVLLSCDTVLAGVDLEHFIGQHCGAMVSASVLLFRPATAPKRVEGRKKTHAMASEQPTFTHAYTAVGYEEGEGEWDGATSLDGGAVHRDSMPSMATSWSGSPLRGSVLASPSSFAGAVSEGVPMSAMPPQGGGLGRRHRLHYMYPVEERPEVRVTMPFAARRPRLTFAADVVDAHVYVVRNWVLHFIAASAGVPEVTVRNHVMPLLTRSQHTTVNTAHNVVLRPEDKIKHNIPVHWMYAGNDVTVHTLNAASGAAFAERADTLRVDCVIYDEVASVACKIVRINSENNYRAANYEILSAKSMQLGLDDGRPAAPSTSTAGQHQPNATTSSTSHNDGTTRITVPQSVLLSEGAAASAQALSFLLPDRPFSLHERLGSLQVSILASFVDSTLPPNVYITRSVIGPNVVIGPGARVTDSVVLANAEIGAKAVVVRSVIGTSAVVNPGRRVVHCTVAPRCIVEADEEDSVVE